MKRGLIAALLALAAAAASALEVNQASQAELESLKGIGPALSAKILDARRQAEFKDWADLLARVNGLGRSAAARLSAGGLTVDGAPYSMPAVPTTPSASSAR